MNNCTLIGRLTKDPELRFAAGTGKAVATFTLAVNRGFGNNEADFFRTLSFNKTAENAANYLSKGSQVGIQGRIQNRTYETNSGEKRYITEIIANTIEFLDGKGKKQENGNNFDDEDCTEGFQTVDDDEEVLF